MQSRRGTPTLARYSLGRPKRSLQRQLPCQSDRCSWVEALDRIPSPRVEPLFRTQTLYADSSSAVQNFPNATAAPVLKLKIVYMHGMSSVSIAEVSKKSRSS
jgi:hypothetical protein